MHTCNTMDNFQKNMFCFTGGQVKTPILSYKRVQRAQKECFAIITCRSLHAHWISAIPQLSNGQKNQICHFISHVLFIIC